MHELGHNLGLWHGGFEGCNYKPNYNSVMNYQYSFGIFRDCAREFLADLDYSIGEKSDLDENSLDENIGICESVEVDWNSDGVMGVVQHNINSAEAEQQLRCGGTFTTLKDHDDWGNILYLGPANPNLLMPWVQVVY